MVAEVAGGVEDAFGFVVLALVEEGQRQGDGRQAVRGIVADGSAGRGQRVAERVAAQLQQGDGGLAVPAVRLENRSDQPVTVIGAAGEPFARIGPGGVAVNVRSPTWVAALHSRGQTPVDVADASAAPRWQRVFGDPRWSWPEFRGRPPDAEPPPHVLAADDEVVVGRWDVPIQLGDRRVSLRGVTSFVPLAAGAGDGGGSGRVTLVVVPALALVTLAAAMVVLPRRGRPVGRAGPQPGIGGNEHWW